MQQLLSKWGLHRICPLCRTKIIFGNQAISRRKFSTPTTFSEPPVTTDTKEDSPESSQDATSSVIDSLSSSNPSLTNRNPGVRRHPPLRRIGPFNPDEFEPAPLIQDLVRRINYWRTHPRRQEREELLRIQRQILSTRPPEEPAPSPNPSSNLASVNSNDEQQSFSHSAQPSTFSEPLLTRTTELLPRSPIRKPYTLPNLAQLIIYVNEIWSVLKILPTAKHTSNILSSFDYPNLPGICPYPELRSRGFTQPRPGEFLITRKRPQPITRFSSKYNFAQYIYSLAFHSGISARMNKMIVSAFLNADNVPYLTENAFRYAMTSLVERSSDIRNAQRLVAYMNVVKIPISLEIHNLLLLASMNVESLHSFALILREILERQDIEANSTTWNIVLRMGLKLKSPNWVHSVLEVMKTRKIPLDHYAIQVSFQTLKGLVSSTELKEHYLKRFQREKFVIWKGLHVVLQALCEDGKIDEVWDLFLQAAEAEKPPEASLHLFIRMCKRMDDYERAWKIIGEFRHRWRTEPHSQGVAEMFKFACEKEEFSDALLIWGYARLYSKRWKMDPKMRYQGKELEKLFGVPLNPGPPREVIKKVWIETVSGRRNRDVFYLIPKDWKQHVRMMKARKDSEELPDGAELSEDVRLWREIERTYDAAVAAGFWKPRDPPPHLPDPNPQRRYIPNGANVKLVKIKRISKRVYLGLNFEVKGKVMVWEMVQRGAIKL